MRATVRDLLDSFEPFDATEAEHARRMRELLDGSQPPGPFARDHYLPGHFTASAFVLSPDEQDLLLVLHGKLGRWLQPGGHFEPQDADPLAAARREVQEETGLGDVRLASNGLFDVDVHVIPPRATEPRHEHFDLRFLFVASSREAKAGSDARDTRWVPVVEVARVETDDSVLRAVKRLLRRRV